MKSSWSPESRERSAENGANGKDLRNAYIWMTSGSLPSGPQRAASRAVRADIRGSKFVCDSDVLTSQVRGFPDCHRSGRLAHPRSLAIRPQQIVTVVA